MARGNWPYRFHIDIGFHPDVELPSGNFDLDPSKHSKKKARTKYKDRDMDPPESIWVRPEDVFEVYVDKYGVVRKACAKFTWTADEDITCCFDPLDGYLVTWWFDPAGYTPHEMALSLYDLPGEVEFET